MRGVKINFYGEEIVIELPSNFENFKKEISDNFHLEPSDVDELIIFYKEEGDKILISSQSDFQSFSKENSELAEIFLEVSEKSKLYKKEMESSKFSKFDFSTISFQDDLNLTLIKQEALRKEIEEKERLLKALEEKERVEREKKEREKGEKEKREQNEKEKEKLRESIAKTVTEIINNSIEKVKEELINKTILETTSALEKVELNDSKIKLDKLENMTSSSNVRASQMFKPAEQPNERVIHKRVRCDGCGVYPIVGIRYKCTKCFDFDYCENCEETNSSIHPHAFIKYRTARDKTKKKKTEDQNDEDDQGLFDKLKSKFNNIVSLLSCEREDYPSKCKKPKYLFDDLTIKKTNENLICGVKENEDCFKYAKQMEEMKKNFYLVDFTDVEIISALEEANGQTDEALEILINYNK